MTHVGSSNNKHFVFKHKFMGEQRIWFMLWKKTLDETMQIRQFVRTNS